MKYGEFWLHLHVFHQWRTCKYKVAVTNLRPQDRRSPIHEENMKASKFILMHQRETQKKSYKYWKNHSFLAILQALQAISRATCAQLVFCFDFLRWLFFAMPVSRKIQFWSFKWKKFVKMMDNFQRNCTPTYIHLYPSHPCSNQAQTLMQHSP